jgi:hypothetical protein
VAPRKLFPLVQRPRRLSDDGNHEAVLPQDADLDAALCRIIRGDFRESGGGQEVSGVHRAPLWWEGGFGSFGSGLTRGFLDFTVGVEVPVVFWKSFRQGAAKTDETHP